MYNITVEGESIFITDYKHRYELRYTNKWIINAPDKSYDLDLFLRSSVDQEFKSGIMDLIVLCECLKHNSSYNRSLQCLQGILKKQYQGINLVNPIEPKQLIVLLKSVLGYDVFSRKPTNSKSSKKCLDSKSVESNDGSMSWCRE